MQFEHQNSCKFYLKKKKSFSCLPNNPLTSYQWVAYPGTFVPMSFVIFVTVIFREWGTLGR